MFSILQQFYGKLECGVSQKARKFDHNKRSYLGKNFLNKHHQYPFKGYI